MTPKFHIDGALLEACRALDPVLHRDGRAPAETVAQAAVDGLRRLAPGAPLYACLLEADGTIAIGVCDEAGSAEPRGAKALREMLKRAASSTGDRSACLPVGRSDKLPGHALALHPLKRAGHHYGVLAVLLAKAGDDVPSLRQPLEAFAQHVSLLLAWRHERAQLGPLQQQLAEETRRGDIGELVGPALHEVGNFINSVFLTLAVLERKVPAELRGDFSGLRKQGHAVAALAGQIQQTRRATAGPPINLQTAVREALAWLQASAAGGDGLTITVVEPDIELSPERPAPLRQGASIELGLAATDFDVGGRSDVKRLCRFLLKNAVGAAGAGGRIAVATEAVRSGVVLRIADSGPSLSDEQLHHFWDANEGLARPGTNALELATCWSLSKRLGGKLQAENGPDGGFVITLRLPLIIP